MKLTAVLSMVVMTMSTTLTLAEVAVQPVGLLIGSPAIEAMDFNFRPNGVNAGTSVHLLISGLDVPIVKLDDDNCTLDKAVDSTGRDMLEERPKEDNSFWI